MIIVLIIVSALLILLVGGYFLFLVRPRAAKPKNEAILCDYAHRGLYGNGVPENSLRAFSLACEAGYGIELDVQLSLDGEVMVFHDDSLARMTGCDKLLCRTDASELQKLRLLDSEETIPTLQQVLETVNGRVPLLIELKGESTKCDLCEKVASILREYRGPYCIESFNPVLLHNIQKYLPDAYLGQLYTHVCRERKQYTPLYMLLSIMAFNFLARPDFIAYHLPYRNSFAVKLTTRFYGAERFIWTIQTEMDLAEARALGEHAIFETEQK